MASRHTVGDAKTLRMSMWLVFNPEGNIRLTRDEPSISAKERAMQLTLNVPRSIFKTPSLRGEITLNDQNFDQHIAQIATDAASVLGITGLELELHVHKEK